MTQALRPNRLIKVLEVGTGSGYQASILSRLFRRVYTVERYKELLKTAEERFSRLRISNITARVGDGNQGWREQAPFQRIIVTAAASEIPGSLVDQLGEDGVMIIPLARPGREQEVVRVQRGPEGLKEEHLTTVRFVPLVRGLPKTAIIKSA
jgi:protein-L-isoaspartate(D-aspartate) O-methyltransferase